MKNILLGYYTIIGCLLLSSCLFEDVSECPSGLLVTVSVKDKNYFNIDQFEALSKVDEKQPFTTFIHTLSYELNSLQTGQTIQKSILSPLSSSNATYSFPIDKLPEGSYVLTVWGNLSTGQAPDELHPDRLESTDLYLASRRIEWTGSSATVSLELERTKGKLVLFCRNFPPTIRSTEEEIDPVYQRVSPFLVYSGQTQVEKKASFSALEEWMIAPSPEGDPSKLDVRFYTADPTRPALTLPPLQVTIRRNELTAIRIDYNNSQKYWEIWCYIDSRWALVHHLDIY